MRSVCLAIVAIAIISLAVLSADCQALIAIDDRYLVSDASPCDHRAPPPPPQVVDAGGSMDLVFAIQVFDYGTEAVASGPQRSQKIGFDLDDTCTGEGQGTSCAEPRWADASHHDGVDGIDNASGVWLYGWFGPTFQPNRQSGNGLIRVRGYNGQSDDDQVEVCGYASLGNVPRDADGGPLWDGLDRWTIHPGSLVPPGPNAAPDRDRPRYCDEHAYVSGNVLVSRMDESYGPSFLTTAPTFLSRARNLVSAGRIVQNDAGVWELKDVVSGWRVLLSDAIFYWAQGETDDGTGPVPNCMKPERVAWLKQTICPLADIAFDAGSPTAPCNAISQGVIFQAKQALLGDVIDASSTPASCPSFDPTCP